MSKRLSDGGLLIDRSQPVFFSWNGTKLKGFKGDTLASALLANGKTLVGRSFKYHRPRGIVASGAEEPNALVNLGAGARFEPNQRATTTELFEGLEAKSQNHWPSLEFDIGSLNTRLSKFFPAGFYYKTFIHPRAAWKHLFEPVIRQSAGLGKAPVEPDADRYEHFYAHVDVLVIGGGMAGLLAAEAAGAKGAKVLLVEQTSHFGGRVLVDETSIDGKDGPAWIAGQTAKLKAMENVSLRTRMMGAGVYDHGYVLAYERLTDHAPKAGGPRHRLWRIRAKQIITATGAIERPLAFAGNDVPGVMLASAVRDYITLYGAAPGERVVVATNNDDAYQTALTAKAAGVEVPVIVDARDQVESSLVTAARAAGIRVELGHAIGRVEGGKQVSGVGICQHAGQGGALENIPCDVVAMSGGWSPVVHLWSHCGGKLNWSEEHAHFAPDPARPPLGEDGAGFVQAAGSAAGAISGAQAAGGALNAGDLAAERAGFEGTTVAVPVVAAPEQAAMRPVWVMPKNAMKELKAKAFLDFQNDVKVADVQLAAQEGYESVEHAKRYTTLGMATDQGKLSNINGLAVLADSLGAAIPSVGTTTFRPPYTPISMGSIGGDARGELFKPTRKTPMDAWHAENGAVWEPVADWRRPYAYSRGEESKHDAVTREILNTRQNCGLLDASTLGKIRVKGPDAAKFLDLIYTNMMSTLKVGRCRYGLMCTENGFLFDDGVVARIGEDEFLCHTTSGGSDRVHAWVEEWLQTEWWDFKVYTANVTEQLAQIAVVGPKARELLQVLGGMDLSDAALPFMSFKDGAIGGFDCRAYRISFSGELSYEIAIAASQGQAFWDSLLMAGKSYGVMPYGTEALHVMRAEKGFIMIGDETDGTVIPQDLGLGWAVSKKKDDFVGKRAMERSYLTGDHRKQLVGLETENPEDVLPDGAHAVSGNANIYGVAETLGHVTSTYFSPTLKRSIAMALIKGGRARMGETLEFPVSEGSVIKAKLVDPVFLDKAGERQNV